MAFYIKLLSRNLPAVYYLFAERASVYGWQSGAATAVSRGNRVDVSSRQNPALRKVNFRFIIGRINRVDRKRTPA